MKYILTQEEMDEHETFKKSNEQWGRLHDALRWARDQLKQERCGKTHCDTCKLSWIGFDRVGEEFVNKVAGKNGVPTQEISATICPNKHSYSK